MARERMRHSFGKPLPSGPQASRSDYRVKNSEGEVARVRHLHKERQVCKETHKVLSCRSHPERGSIYHSGKPASKVPASSESHTSTVRHHPVLKTRQGLVIHFDV